MFFSSLKNCFYAISIVSQQLSIDKLSIKTLQLFLIAFSIASSIHRETFCLLESISIATSIHRVSLLRKPLDSSSIALDRSSFMIFLYKGASRFLTHFLQSLSIVSLFFHSQTPQTQTPHISHLIYGLNQVFFIWYDTFLLINHAFHSFQT